MPPPERIPPELKFKKTDVEIGGPIGRGVSGSVYRGKVISSGNDVAIKVIRSPKSSAGSTDTTHKTLDYKSEIATLAMLQHSNIIKVLGYCEGDREDETYILFELAKGSIAEHSLADLRATKPVAHMLQVLDWCLQVARGLEYIHSQGVLHLDLKPGNILLFDNNVVKICDFGTSKLLNGSNDDTTRPMDYTARYVSPESATGNKVSRESDIYSFGCVMLEHITGLPPWHHLQPTSALDALRDGIVLNVDDYTWPLPCSKDVRALVTRLLMYDPEERGNIAEAIRVIESAKEAVCLQLAEQITSQPLGSNWLEGVAERSSLEVAVALLIGYHAPPDRPDTNFSAECIRNVIPGPASKFFIAASPDEKALFMYTAQSPVSKIINAALSENNKNSVNLPYVSPMCKRLYRAIQNLGTAYTGPAFRVLFASTPALQNAFKNFKVAYAQGTSIEFTQFSSFTKDLSRIESFTTTAVGDQSVPLIVFHCDNLTAFDINIFNIYNESEVIALPPSYFTVSKPPYKVQQAVHVHLTFHSDESEAATYLIRRMKTNIAASFSLRLITQASAELAKIADRCRLLQKADPGDSELHTAAQSGNVVAIKSQFKSGADHSARNNAGATPLFKAAQSGHAAAIRTLSCLGAGAHAPTNSGVTPLLAAVLGDHADAIHALVACGVAAHDASLIAKTIVSAIHFKTTSALKALLLHVEIKKPLVIKLASHMSYDIPLLTVAASLGNVKAIEALVNFGADIDARDTTGATAMHAAASLDDAQIFDALMSFGADIDACDNAGATAMHAAASLGHVHFVNAVINALLTCGRKVDLKNKDGSTPLVYAALCGAEEIIQALISSGANVDAAREDGSTPLHAAAQENRVAAVKALVKHGCKVDPKKKDGSTPLYLAAFHGHVEVIEALISSGADVAAVREDDSTTLHAAAYGNHVAAAEALLRYGCKVDSNKKGATPLLVAAIFGHVEVIEALKSSSAADAAAD
ncbi:protein kinase, putative [Bodo saltans]|uniref:Protein kinase, putative n=1 Tax=Bodo saltans TaxID=75058 RepID=A0A0S4IRZ4_BODSA|nr:protein kinase, putative [Bodo saltans]|eukprot:CUG04468.1 protein kinase, putative [Bodo saltans]